MNEFPRTEVGGLGLPRLIAGTNWFLGYSHQTEAKDRLIRTHQTRERIAATLEVYLRAGVDAVMGPPSPLLDDAVRQAEDAVGRAMVRILTPSFRLRPGDTHDPTSDEAFDLCRTLGAAICMPHMCVTDVLLDRLQGEIRGLDGYTRQIRERGMIPGLSTHMPETVTVADGMGAGVETYIQIYNAAGFLMHVEAEWALRVIQRAKKPVMVIKPLAAGRLTPLVGLSFVWNTIRPLDMVIVGASSPDEAREVIDLSLDLLSHRPPASQLQESRSKRSLASVA